MNRKKERRGSRTENNSHNQTKAKSHHNPARIRQLGEPSVRRIPPCVPACLPAPFVPSNNSLRTTNGPGPQCARAQRWSGGALHPRNGERGRAPAPPALRTAGDGHPWRVTGGAPVCAPPAANHATLGDAMMGIRSQPLIGNPIDTSKFESMETKQTGRGPQNGGLGDFTRGAGTEGQ